ncbi:MAG TPA: KTSC domain-containing protein [Ramlibacter sp.]|nr:KTSC domain-containing protein [Ramlibacter sp.]
MPTQMFTSGRIRKAVYDATSRQLDLHWENKSILAYKHVPQEVYRRLCSAPNPATYWEDRIAEEYPKGTPMTSNADPDGAKKLSDLFGGGDE